MKRRDAITRFLNGHPDKGYCDACIALVTQVETADVARITMELRSFLQEFTLWYGPCFKCGEKGRVTTMATRRREGPGELPNPSFPPKASGW